MVGNSPSEVLLKALADVISTLFNLFCFTKQNVSHLRSVFFFLFFSSVSFMVIFIRPYVWKRLKVVVPYRTSCQEILIWCLSHSERSVALSLLKCLCGLLGEVGGVRHGFQFSPGSEGGARLTVRELIRYY